MRYRKKSTAVLASVGVITGIAGAIYCYKSRFRMSLKKYTQYALYMAVLDDEICRNELEGYQIDHEEIVFPPKVESLQYRYHLFLQMNRKKSKAQVLQEIAEMEKRLEVSKQYADAPKGELEVGIV